MNLTRESSEPSTPIRPPFERIVDVDLRITVNDLENYGSAPTTGSTDRSKWRLAATTTNANDLHSDVRKESLIQLSESTLDYIKVKMDDEKNFADFVSYLTSSSLCIECVVSLVLLLISHFFTWAVDFYPIQIHTALAGGWLWSFYNVVCFNFKFNPIVGSMILINIVLSLLHCLILKDFSFSGIRAFMIDFPLVEVHGKYTSTTGWERSLFRFISDGNFQLEVLLSRIHEIERPLIAYTWGGPLLFTDNYQLHYNNIESNLVFNKLLKNYCKDRKEIRVFNLNDKSSRIFFIRPIINHIGYCIQNGVAVIVTEEIYELKNETNGLLSQEFYLGIRHNKETVMKGLGSNGKGCFYRALFDLELHDPSTIMLRLIRNVDPMKVNDLFSGSVGMKTLVKSFPDVKFYIQKDGFNIRESSIIQAQDNENEWITTNNLPSNSKVFVIHKDGISYAGKPLASLQADTYDSESTLNFIVHSSSVD